MSPLHRVDILEQLFASPELAGFGPFVITIVNIIYIYMR